MKQKYMIYGIFLILSLLVFGNVFAQETTDMPPDLPQTVDVEEFGFRFNVPEDWQVEVSGGTTFSSGPVAEPTPSADVDVASISISLSWLPSGFTSPNELLYRSGCTVLRSDQGTINLRPSVTAICESSSGDGVGDGQSPENSIFAFWIQDGQLFILSLDVPDNSLLPESEATFLTILATVRPILVDTINFSGVYEATDLELIIRHPDEWSVHLEEANQLAFYERDINSADAPTGILIDIRRISTVDQESNLITDILDAHAENPLDWDANQSTGNFKIMDQSGFGLIVTAVDRSYHYYIVTAESKSLTIWHLRTPDESTFADYTPIFLTMLLNAQRLIVPLGFQLQTGLWASPPDSNWQVSFTVTEDGQIVDFHAQKDLSVGICAIDRSSVNVDVSGAFLIELGSVRVAGSGLETYYDGERVYSTFDGMFDSATTVNGTISSFQMCDDLITLNTSDGTPNAQSWTATWQESE